MRVPQRGHLTYSYQPTSRRSIGCLPSVHRTRNVTISVLLVDDNTTVRHSLRNFLEAAGFEICGEAEDGFQAIQKTAALHPDLVILDLAMPNMRGLGAAAELRRVHPDVSIILYTLFASSVLEVQARAAGISSVVAKEQPPSVLIRQAKALLH